MTVRLCDGDLHLYCNRYGIDVSLSQRGEAGEYLILSRDNPTATRTWELFYVKSPACICAALSCTDYCLCTPSRSRLQCVVTDREQVRNLPEKMNVNKLVAEIREMFSVFGDILEIVAKKNLKARGQAFVVFDSADSAKEAIDELQGFEIGGKEIQLAFAKSRSDATVQREDGEEGLEVHKTQRLAEKERKQAVEAAEAAKRAASKRAADEANGDRPAKKVAAAGAAAADEHLPPNKTLILRELPEDYTQQILSSIFGRYPGFKEIRMVPGRAGLAFAEYETEDGAIMAKTEMHQKVLAGKTVKVTYQRQ
nr:U1 small nuclear ribonucleoprotein usp102-like [Quercus suber]